MKFVFPELQKLNLPYIFVQVDKLGSRGIAGLLKIQVLGSSLEEMIRTYLKQLLIKSTRLWKVQHLDGLMVSRPGADIQLVEANYKERHNVADYADMLLLAPKTLTPGSSD